MFSSKFNKSRAFPVANESFPDADIKFCRENNFVHLSAKISALVPVKNSYSLTLSVTPCGDFASFKSLRSGNPILTRNTNITIGMLQIDYSNGSFVPRAEKDSSFLFDEGDFNLYPLDKYDTGVVPVMGIYSNELDNNNSYPVPLALTIQGSIQGFRTAMVMIDDVSNSFDPSTRSYINTLDGTILAFRMVFTRAWTTLFFSALVMIITWTLPLMVFILSVTLLARGRAVEPPTIMFFVNLLFTLPVIRRAQPSIPKDPGCLSDVVSYFWAITLQTLSAILMLTNYIHKYRKPNVGVAPTAAERRDNKNINAILVAGDDAFDNNAMDQSDAQVADGGGDGGE
ncbi:hypothetical protein DFJ73DRAFT_847992 [Zopfochytrium polystomum]|nr:hypothetical protein DFJ73DRAFT_847992 [Zopfochytrium polystomum]